MAVFENNPAPQDFTLAKTDDEKEGYLISHIKTSGRTDKFFFLPMDLPHLSEEFAKLVGTPSLPPKWAFGWHLSKKGVNGIGELTQVLSVSQ